MLPTVEKVFDAPAESTTRVSSWHVAQVDLNCIRQRGWPLPYKLTADRIWLALASEATATEFARQLREQGFSAAFTDLVRWAANDGSRWLLIDADAELNDRLLIFVG
jgi:hypothetical protein